VLKNTAWVYGIVTYVGVETKIYQNSQQPRHKTTKAQRLMNQILYSVFMFQLLLVILFASLSMVWQANNGEKHSYLSEEVDPSFDTLLLKMLTYWVAYSHLIPISLYVGMEILKMFLSKLVTWDKAMYDPI
jgi:magnesium-transporting ATPase (P-type)